ncbi:histidine phosphatase family protein [Lactococcus protaetiae]|uniref:Histidine phosphatase family protein n=1 Tax=Lactococcus protaetiae TaxID=2592653 RepID=A0A514Z9Z4_9LACT|nr:histidine phosphatase family protein [Lactococcus protaetiae]QDK71414.1 histidine phosphatase family protein [Lactococcus protaetiae]
MVNIYLVRHGKTMFNTIGRAQGWSDTPLTEAGELGIIELGLGFKEKGIKFDRAYSSDSGRTIQTMGFILSRSDNEGIPYKFDKRIREWCFGSFDGGYDGELFDGVLPRIFAENGSFNGTFPDDEKIANAIFAVDTAGWAESWEKLSGRIIEGFTDIAREAEATGSKNIVIVSHGMTIGSFVKLINPDMPRPRGLDNGSVTHLTFEKDKFTVGLVGDMSYRTLGNQKLNALQN